MLRGDVSDSFVDIHLKDGTFKIDASVFNDDIKLSSKIFWKNRHKNSNLRVDIKTTKMREVLGIISAHNVYDTDIFGDLDMEVDANFALSRLEEFDMSLRFNELYYENKDISLKVDESNRKILIEDGRVKFSKIVLQGEKTELSAEVKQSSDRSLLFLLGGNMNADIIRVLDKNIIKSDGIVDVDASFNFLGDINNTKIGFTVKSKNLDVTYLGIPASFENINVDFSLKGNRFHINEFSGVLGGGKLKLDGSVLLKVPFPVFDLNYNFENSEIKIFEKTKFWTSSKGTISGNKIPYDITGDIYITSGEVFDNLENFKVAKKKRGFDNYIPQFKKVNRFNFFNINSRLAILESVHVKNDLIDIYIHGSMYIIGGGIIS